MASALPLPGFFALAALMDDAEQPRDPAARTKLLPIRDTLFVGPLLVIPFNWTFAHALVALPPDREPRRAIRFSSRCGPSRRSPCCWLVPRLAVDTR